VPPPPAPPNSFKKELKKGTKYQKRPKFERRVSKRCLIERPFLNNVFLTKDAFSQN